MKIISWNVNGIRSIHKKCFLNWLEKSKADIVCLQEIKAQKEKVPVELVNLKNYFSYFNPAIRPGYSGTAIFTKIKPLKIETKMGFKKFDQEGRFLKLDFPKFSLIDFYMPNGSRDKGNLKYKLEVYKKLLVYLKKFANKKLIIIGDFNIAHEEIDLARPKENKNNIMFTPEERKQIGEIIKLGFIDSFRELNREGGNYTWWPYFANARQRNLGWRIDYLFISKELKSGLKKVFIEKDTMGSDHCPTGIEINI